MFLHAQVSVYYHLLKAMFWWRLGFLTKRSSSDNDGFLLQHCRSEHNLCECFYASFVVMLGARVEEFVYEKVQGSKPQPMLENDVLGQHMIDAGNDFGPGTSYGM